MPNFIPPKYRTTIINLFTNDLFFITFSICLPAVPEGSPSSVVYSTISGL